MPRGIPIPLDVLLVNALALGAWVAAERELGAWRAGAFALLRYAGLGVLAVSALFPRRGRRFVVRAGEEGARAVAARVGLAWPARLALAPVASFALAVALAAAARAVGPLAEGAWPPDPDALPPLPVLVLLAPVGVALLPFAGPGPPTGSETAVLFAAWALTAAALVARARAPPGERWADVVTGRPRAGAAPPRPRTG